ncbi:MAG: hypothetical protein PIR02_15840 [Microbacterium enclense]
MGDISRRSLIVAGVWSAPVVAVAMAVPAAAASGETAGTVNEIYRYQQFANSVNWTWNATNDTSQSAVLTVVFDLGPFTFGGWLTSAWSRSVNTYVSNAAVAPSAQVGNCTIVLQAPSGTSGTVTATVMAEGAQPRVQAFAITIP